MTPYAQLRRWVRRAAVPPATLTRALVAATVASATSLGLFVGAAALLVLSAAHPGLRAVAALLVLIELFAFLRSPIRFVERVSTHRLGFAAVTRWRMWLMGTVGTWSFQRWSSHAHGDVLSRSLQDTEELQDLWVRSLVPALSSLASLVVADIAVSFLPPRPHWLLPALGLLASQGAATALLVRAFPRLVTLDRERRQRRAEFQSQIVELSLVAPDLELLGRAAYAAARLDAARRSLTDAEVASERARTRLAALVPVTALLGVGILAVFRPVAAPLWLVGTALVLVAGLEVGATLSSALETAVAVTAATERLDDLAEPETAGSRAWPDTAPLMVRGLVLRTGPRTLVDGVDLTLTRGRRVAVTGASGVGKSWLLRVVAGLDAADGGTIVVGDRPLDEIAESEVRRHIAYVPSEPGLLRGRPADVIALGRTPSRSVADDLAAVGVVIDANTRWEGLARGESARVAVVRALAISPDVVVLDEPTAGLGSPDTAALLDLLERSGAAIVVATHDPAVTAWADEVIGLDGGPASG
ncbi:MAG: ATP-binding cassette domain-containing protein [Acidimicrobiales bacterium]